MRFGLIQPVFRFYKNVHNLRVGGGLNVEATPASGKKIIYTKSNDLISFMVVINRFRGGFFFFFFHNKNTSVTSIWFG